MSKSSTSPKISHRQVRTISWPQFPPVVKKSEDLPVVKDDPKYCSAPCRHHPKSEKYPTVGEGKLVGGLQKFVEDLAVGLKGVFPNRQATYNRVHALLISWGPNDDLRTFIEIGRLEQMFRRSYHFTTEEYIIPAASSEHRLEEKCIEARRDHAGARDLLIVYYGGHGSLEGNKSMWHAWKNKPTTATTRRTLSPDLDWTEAQRSLMKADGDVLFILDCCYAPFTIKIEPRGGTKELLAATTFNEEAIGVDDNSFTMAFIRELESINQLPCTASMIHGRLLNHRHENKKAIPEYVSLFQTIYAQSIVLAPQRIEEASETQVNAGRILLEQPVLMTGCRILISIALDNPYQPPDFSQWHEWFKKAAPRNIKDVKLYIRPEGVWESTSIFYLFSMPAALWNSLPSNPAYKMLAIIKSDNLLKPQYVSRGIQVQKTADAMEQHRGSSNLNKAYVMIASILKRALWSAEVICSWISTLLVPQLAQPKVGKKRLKLNARMSLLMSSHDAMRSSTFAFFGYEDLQPDRGGPFQLFLKDVMNLLWRSPLLFVALWPPYTNRPLDELYLFDGNIFALAWFGLWSINQAPSILAIFVVLILVVIIFGILAWVNWAIFWRTFQGPLLQVYPRNLPPNVIPGSPIFKQRWIYINGIATGQTILHQNLKLLSQTFGTQTDHRPILGINNRTYGFLGDIVESILQRTFGFQTSETRLAVPILENYLNDSGIDRIVLIAHSQGGILVSHILDNLYASIAGPNLRKLEVYTFANAALRFHNPWDKTTNTHAIQHIEHYCNEHDLVCSWGALSSNSTRDSQFHGKVFVYQGATGHLLNQFYLSRMFPLPPITEHYLNAKVTPDTAIPEKYWVSRTGIEGRLGDRVRDISRLHQYLNGETPQ